VTDPIDQPWEPDPSHDEGYACFTKERRVVADDGTPLAEGAGRYEYPHDRADGIGTQDYLGVAKRYYRPTDRGLEKAIGEHLAQVRALRARARDGGSAGGSAGGGAGDGEGTKDSSTGGGQR